MSFGDYALGVGGEVRLGPVLLLWRIPNAKTHSPANTRLKTAFQLAIDKVRNSHAT